MNFCGLHAIAEEQTRIETNSQTIIDQVIINKSLWEYNYQVIDTGFFIVRSLYAQIQELHNITQENSSQTFLLFLSPCLFLLTEIKPVQKACSGG